MRGEGVRVGAGADTDLGGVVGIAAGRVGLGGDGWREGGWECVEGAVGVKGKLTRRTSAPASGSAHLSWRSNRYNRPRQSCP